MLAGGVTIGSAELGTGPAVAAVVLFSVVAIGVMLVLKGTGGP